MRLLNWGESMTDLTPSLACSFPLIAPIGEITPVAPSTSRSTANSIWNKKQLDNPLERQAGFPDTHEHNIEDDVFEKVQVIRQQRHRMTRTGRSSIFSGLVCCADCGFKMKYGSSNNGDLAHDFFDFSLHKKHR